MDPFTIALATFGIQKLRGKSTNRALRDAALAGGIGQVAGMAGVGQSLGRFAPQAFGQTSLPGMTGNFVGQTTGPAGQIVNQSLMEQAKTSGGGIYDLGKNLIGKPTEYNKAGDIISEGSGFRDLSTGAQLGLGLGATTLLAGEDEPTEMPEGTRPEDYKAAKEKADKQLENLLSTYDYESEAAGISPYSYQQGNSLFTFNKGG